MNTSGDSVQPSSSACSVRDTPRSPRSARPRPPPDAGRAGDAPAADAADARSAHAGLRGGEGVAGWRGAACRCRGQLHHRPDAQSRAGDDGAGRRAAGHGLQLHDELGGQQDLSGHRARRGHVRHARSRRSGQADRDDQPSGAVHATRRRVRAEAIRARARSRRSSSAPTVRTSCCSRRSTT